MVFLGYNFPRMKVLFCASECAPIVKVGGLGDVAGALPKALRKLGLDIRVVIPLYGIVDRQKFPLNKVAEIKVPYARQDNIVVVYETILLGSDVPVFLLENNEYLSQGKHEAFAGLEAEIRRFGFFDRALGVWLRESPFWQPDLIHLNDWHTSLVPHFVKKELPNPPAFLLTIHNLAYQGLASLDLFSETDLSIESSRVISWDADDNNVDFLLQGIAEAEVITTVSPTYAREIMTEEFGEGLSGVLRAREARVFGIINGIDDSFNPATDPEIFKRYDVSSWEEGKAVNKRRLQEELGLPLQPETPVLAFIGRLEPIQKGLDLIEKAWGKLVREDVQLIVLGMGDLEWEGRFRKLGERFPEKFSAQIKFDNRLARQLLAGADILLMPSKFEPCGLPQMMAMRYGTVPLVRAVGGLADTVEAEKTGFLFEKYDANELVKKVKEALALYRLSKLASAPVPSVAWQSLVTAGMARDFSWENSAKQYVDLYRKALEYRFGVAHKCGGEYRDDQFTGEWVIVAGERKKRGSDLGLKGAGGKFTGCPFDEGNEAQTPPEVLRIGRGAPNGPGWEVRVTPNKFPILPAHEVIIHSPSHDKDLADLPLEQVERVAQAYVSRSRSYNDKGFPYLFNNHGSEAGASLKHPHSQLIVFDRIPKAVEEELAGAEEYYHKNHRCPYCDLVERNGSGERFVWENSGFLVVVPFASSWPYELWVLPKIHRANFADVEDAEILALAEVLKLTTGVFKKEFDDPSYNYWIHSLPKNFAEGERPIFYHWHLEFAPRMKKLGGVELGAEVMVYDQETPEAAAVKLRQWFGGS